MLFWFIIVLSTLIVLALLLRPLAVNKAAGMERTDDQLRISIYQQNLRELDREFERGQLTREQLDNVRNELELSLLGELEREQALKQSAEQASARQSGRLSAALPVVVITVLAVPLYLLLGNPQLNELKQFSELARQSDGQQPLPLETVIPQMQQHLERNPGDANGWLLLADIYSSAQQPAAAVGAFERLYQLTGEDTDVMLRYANALVVANGGSFAGKAAELAQRVLAMEPENYTALLFSGMAADEAGDYQLANQHYRKLLPVLQGNATLEQTITSLIARNEQLLRDAGIDPVVAESVESPPADAAVASLNVSVNVSGDLAGKYGPDDTVFVYAQAIDGPPMPLAVARHKAAELPLTVTLNDSMAMMPAMKLSAFAKVKLQARISKSGNAQPETGDLVGVLEPVDVPSTGSLSITIDSVFP